MEKNRLALFDKRGNTLKSRNWLLIIVIALSIVGIGFLIYYNWENIKIRWQKKIQVDNFDFSATIAFDEATNILKVAIQYEQKQAFSMSIFNGAMQEVSKNTITKDEQQFDLSTLEKGDYKSVVSAKDKTVIQNFTKK